MPTHWSRPSFRLSALAAVLAAAGVTGCGGGNDGGLFPTLAGEGGGRATSAQQASVQPATVRAPGAIADSTLQLGTTDFEPNPFRLGPNTGTQVGARTNQLANDLGELKQNIAQRNSALQDVRTSSIASAQDYFGIVAAISARLQVGTTPGNPILVQQLNDAQLALDQLSTEVTRMNELSTRVAADSSLAAFILESVRATFGLSGAVEEDHRQLSVLEDEVNRTVVLVDRLLNELADDIARQTTYLNLERQNLQTLQLGVANGELYGRSLANRAFATASPASLTAAGIEPPRAQVATDRPLVIIRFDDPNVEYAQPVYQAVSRALDVRPGSTFEIVAVSPQTGDQLAMAQAANLARDRAEEVLRTLVNFGVPPSSLSLTSGRSAEARGGEVRLFVR